MRFLIPLGLLSARLTFGFSVRFAFGFDNGVAGLAVGLTFGFAEGFAAVFDEGLAAGFNRRVKTTSRKS